VAFLLCLDGETFWTEQLPRKLECEIRAIVKVEEKCRLVYGLRILASCFCYVAVYVLII